MNNIHISRCIILKNARFKHTKKNQLLLGEKMFSTVSKAWDCLYVYHEKDHDMHATVQNWGTPCVVVGYSGLLYFDKAEIPLVLSYPIVLFQIISEPYSN